MNWHGKPLSAKAEESINVIKGQMAKQEDWGLRPQPITTKVPAVDISNIKLSEPPNYKIGQQVYMKIRQLSEKVKKHMLACLF